MITALFCDLVAFTASSGSADPEDVDRMLDGYAAMAPTAIESYGGVVEKFIGDAVLGVFGVPAAHEDDPERAVRAGFGSSKQPKRSEAPVGCRSACGSGSTRARRSSGWASPPGRAKASSEATRSTRPRGSNPQLHLELAGRLASTLEPTSAYAEHAEVMVRAMPREADGDLEAEIDLLLAEEGSSARHRLEH